MDPMELHYGKGWYWYLKLFEICVQLTYGTYAGAILAKGFNSKWRGKLFTTECCCPRGHYEVTQMLRIWFFFSNGYRPAPTKPFSILWKLLIGIRHRVATIPSRPPSLPGVFLWFMYREYMPSEFMCLVKF